jgi:hypothetical protein
MRGPRSWSMLSETPEPLDDLWLDSASVYHAVTR